MAQFIKAKYVDDGEECFVNLNLVSSIRETETEYLLNLLGNTLSVKKDCKQIADLINGQS
ncbi:hypothetical protein AAA214_02830 [Parabacteroides goldsteinii]|uniref:hypothetical protein n=1 Tax=Parabacteroides goldsteinii TaxID=328812 RepID=UPI0032BF6DAD